MTPERLQFIKDRLTRHQSCPDAIELGLELARALEEDAGRIETMEADLRRVASGFVDPGTTFTGVVGEFQKAMDDVRNQLIAAREELAAAKQQLADADKTKGKHHR